MLQRLNKEETNIITVEDPVEMSIEGLNQVQVNSEIGLDFAAVLRSILRQDPNVILIGEIRDSETAKIAVRASITGHLVLSTLHTNNSLTTIERLVDMDVERYLLSSSLKGIISQTLAKKLCTHCRVPRPATETEKMLFKKVLGTDIETIYEAGKCEHCHNGYTGRIALQEVLMINDDIRDAINKNVERDDLRHMIYRKGVKTLLQDGLIKVMQGITDLREVFRLVDYDEYDNISEEALEEKKEESEMDKLMHSLQETELAKNNTQAPAKPSVLAVPNNTNPQMGNQIMQTPAQKPNTQPNMFDDNVFNNMKNNNAAQPGAQPANYTNNLVNQINNNIPNTQAGAVQIPNAAPTPQAAPQPAAPEQQPQMIQIPGMPTGA
jgi:Tfp pilus assembly pilus retraction ATPase PilT